MKKYFLSFVVISMFVSSSIPLKNVHAGVPVVDYSAIARLVEQIEQMKQQYDMLKKQYDELVQTKNAVTGSYGVSLLENGPLAEEGRRVMPGTWQEVVALQQSGVIPGIYNERQQYFKKLLPTIDTKLLSSSPIDRNVISYKLSTDNTNAAFSATEAVYDQIQKRVDTIERLMKEIDKTTNVKYATDLNSRIQAENGFLNVEVARLSSMQLALQATMQNNQNQAIANHSEFFSKPSKNNP